MFIKELIEADKVVDFKKATDPANTPITKVNKLLQRIGIEDYGVIINKPFDSKTYELLIDTYMNKVFTGSMENKILDYVIKIYQKRGEKAKELPPTTEGTRCWKGYKKKGMKTMFGKRVPNCVKNEDKDVPCPACGDPKCDHKEDHLKEGEERHLIADAAKDRVVGELMGMGRISMMRGSEIENAAYSILSSLRVEDVVDPNMIVGGQRLGDFASGKVIDLIDSGKLLDDILQDFGVRDAYESSLPSDSIYALRINGKISASRYASKAEALADARGMKKQYKSNIEVVNTKTNKVVKPRVVTAEKSNYLKRPGSPYKKAVDMWLRSKEGKGKDFDDFRDLPVKSQNKYLNKFVTETIEASQDLAALMKGIEHDLANREAEIKENLRAWFGKGKKGGAGGGGWDRYNTKGERIGKCGDSKKGEGKPKCLSKSRAASLRAKGGKKAIGAAVRKKRREDPNKNRKGKAKNVSNTTRKSKKK